jgi:hypothetical protein
MREVALKAATVESTTGLLKIMDDIARLRAAPPPPIAEGGYRLLNVRGDRPRPTRAAAIAPLRGKPMRTRGFLTALFAGGLGLAVLAGPVTCPACDPVHSDGQIDAKRILSRLNYTHDLSADVAARETAAREQADGTVVADRGEPPALSAMALAEPADTAAPLSTAAIGPAPDSTPAAGAAEPSPRAANLPANIEELSDQGPPGTEVAAATIESEPETPLPPVGAATLPHTDIIGVDPGPEEPAPRARAPHKHVLIKQHRAKARAPATHNATPSAPKLYSSNKYAQVPSWAAKMFEAPWQTKAFSFQ